MAKSVLDKDLKKIVRLEKVIHKTGEAPIRSIGLGLLFLLIVLVFSATITGQMENGMFVIAAGVIGGYMALNIGANDVANNVGPAVGSKALTLMGALAIAAVFETAGALIAGGDVVSTISKGIIDPSFIASTDSFIWAMMAALLAAAVWINIATYLGAPVSTTHSIVGGVMGAGMAAAGIQAVNWVTMGKIAASWVISPVLGGVVAAIFLAFIKIMILRQEDKLTAAKRWVPFLIAIMTGVFSMYLCTKGLKKIWKPEPWMIAAIGVSVFAATLVIVRPMVLRASEKLENRRKSVNSLFTLPLICSASLLSFAHGANDVANAVGPLAAIVNAVSLGDIATKVAIPGWVMLVGAAGICVGLVLFGPKLIRMVGEQITKLDQIRAFCAALSAAITVIIASGLGLPVSSTHIAVGGIFGVGFLREYYANSDKAAKAAKAASQAAMASSAGQDDAVTAGELSKKELKKVKKAKKRKLVRRQHLMTIIAAWIITVPCAAFLSAGLFFLLQAFFGQ